MYIDRCFVFLFSRYFDSIFFLQTWKLQKHQKANSNNNNTHSLKQIITIINVIINNDDVQRLSAAFHLQVLSFIPDSTFWNKLKLKSFHKPHYIDTDLLNWSIRRNPNDSTFDE